MTLWLVFAVLTLFMFSYLAFHFWAICVKRRIYQLFELDKDRWWFSFNLRREIDVPFTVLIQALLLMKREGGIETTLVSVRGMEQLVGPLLMPLVIVGYRPKSSDDGGGTPEEVGASPGSLEYALSL